MKKMNKHIFTLSALTILTACGGSNQSEQPDSIVVNPITPPVSISPKLVVTQGMITGFGSIYVDGIKYNTDTSNIKKNGLNTQLNALSVGMKISFSAQENDSGEWVAQDVEYDTEVEGVIQSIDRNNSQITIANTVIFYNDLTHFIDTSETLISVGQRVEISGYPQADGTFLASYIELDTDTDNDDYEYTAGIVSNLDETALQFTINDVVIDYRLAEIDGVLANNSYVKVEGNLVDGVMVANEVDARTVKESLDVDDDSVLRYEIEGLITQISATSIGVNGQVFDYANNVEVEGVALNNLTVGMFVEVYINNSQIIKVESKQSSYSSDGKVKGVIESIDRDNKTITVNGVLYVFNEFSRFEDDDEQYFSFDTLNINDYVEIAYLQTSPLLSVLKIEKEDQDEYQQEWEMKGQITAISNNTITVNGAEIVLDANAKYIINDVLVSLTTFIEQLVVGDRVDVEGLYDINNVFVLGKVELENKSDDGDDDGGDAGDDDNGGDDNKVGYVELEGTVTELLTANSFMLNGYEVQLSENAELEVNDQDVNLATFMSALTVGAAIEVEGQWVENKYILADEAELK
jgi:hypothetical protein